MLLEPTMIAVLTEGNLMSAVYPDAQGMTEPLCAI
jgi:hypothetical protein